jgi:hypothetical protein
MQRKRTKEMMTKKKRRKKKRRKRNRKKLNDLIINAYRRDSDIPSSDDQYGKASLREI